MYSEMIRFLYRLVRIVSSCSYVSSKERRVRCISRWSDIMIGDRIGCFVMGR